MGWRYLASLREQPFLCASILRGGELNALNIQQDAAAIGAALAATCVASVAQADNFTFRIGSGHPKGPAPYVTTMSDFFVAEVKRRAAEETDHKVNFIESYGGGIAGVSETLEAVQSRPSRFRGVLCLLRAVEPVSAQFSVF